MKKLVLISFILLLVPTTGCHASDRNDEDQFVMLRIPGTYDKYAPRDIQLEMKLEKEFLEKFIVSYDLDALEKLNSVNFGLDVASNSPIDLDKKQAGPGVLVHLSIVAGDAIESRLNKKSPRYSSTPFSDMPFISKKYGLDLKEHRPWGDIPRGPVNQQYTMAGNFNFRIKCGDKNNYIGSGCRMEYIESQLSGAERSRFGLMRSIGIDRKDLPNWQKIKNAVDEFVNSRSKIIENPAVGIGK